MTKATVSPMATVMMILALICSLVSLSLGTASFSYLVGWLNCECFVALAFAVHSCTVSAAGEGDGEQAKQG